MYPDLCFKTILMIFLLGTPRRRARVKKKTTTVTAVVIEQS